MKREEILELIDAELKRAGKLHPCWPEDDLRGVAIITEEAGEALREANSLSDYLEFSDTVENQRVIEYEERMIKEIIETGAMVFRFLESFVGSK